jgi:hypothetical protein
LGRGLFYIYPPKGCKLVSEMIRIRKQCFEKREECFRRALRARRHSTLTPSPNPILILTEQPFAGYRVLLKSSPLYSVPSFSFCFRAFALISRDTHPENSGSLRCI